MMMVDLSHFDSLFDIFAIYFAYPVLQERGNDWTLTGFN